MMSEEKKKELEQKSAEAIKKINEPKVLKEIGMRPGEDDIRQLSKKDVTQLNFRVMSDLWAYNNSQHQSLLCIQIILMEMAKKMDIPIIDILNEQFKDKVPTKEEN